MFLHPYVAYKCGNHHALYHDVHLLADPYTFPIHIVLFLFLPGTSCKIKASSNIPGKSSGCKKVRKPQARKERMEGFFQTRREKRMKTEWEKDQKKHLWTHQVRRKREAEFGQFLDEFPEHTIFLHTVLKHPPSNKTKYWHSG